jgi:hypothetical protein
LKNFGLGVHKKNQGLVQKKTPKRNTMIKLSQQGSRISGIKRSLAPGRNQIKRKICQKYNASTVENMVTTRIIVPSLKERKETHEASVAEEKEPSKKTKQDKTNFFF